jgi:hypothetical protein
VHRQKTKLAAHVPRGKRLARAVERYGYATTYALHDHVLSNRDSRRRYASAPPAPDELQRSIVAELDANGYAVVPFAELVADDALVQEVDSQGDAFIADTQQGLAAADAGDESALRRRPGKEFVIRAHSWDGTRLGGDHPWFRACVSARLLDVANAYLRMWSKLTYVDLWYTVPQAEGSTRVASQLWHVDFDDKHLLKAFLYLSDVDPDAGPFEYVPGSQPGGRHSEAWPWTARGTARPPEDEVAQRVDAEEIKTFTAPRGTLILCNTSGLHRGGFAIGKPRVLATATYCSPASLAALSIRNFEVADATALSAAARYAVS